MKHNLEIKRGRTLLTRNDLFLVGKIGKRQFHNCLETIQNLLAKEDFLRENETITPYLLSAIDMIEQKRTGRIEVKEEHKVSSSLLLF